LFFNQNISKNEEFSDEIRRIVSRCGPYYGRKTMKGALAAEGIHASQRRIAAQLREINPQITSKGS
jgi:hypothetical protein